MTRSKVPLSYARGTAFAINNHTLMTNAHNVDMCEYLTVENNGKHYPVKVLAWDKANDLAVISSDVPMPFPAIAVSSKGNLKRGEFVWMAGFSGKYELIRKGEAAFPSNNETRHLPFYDQPITRIHDVLTFPAEKGDSGSPMVDISGQLRGIVDGYTGALKNGVPDVMGTGITHSLIEDFLHRNNVSHYHGEANEIMEEEVKGLLQQGVVQIHCMSKRTAISKGLLAPL